MTAQNQNILNFYPKSSPIYKAIYKWHGDLLEDNGARARLRRCGDPTDAVFTDGYRALLESVVHAAASKQKKDADATAIETNVVASREQRFRLAVVAVILAHVQAHEQAVSVGASLARFSGGGPVLSPLRFRRLLSYTDIADLFTPMLRTIRMFKRSADVTKLGHDLLCWNDDIRREWAYDYFDTLSKNQRTNL